MILRRAYRTGLVASSLIAATSIFAYVFFLDPYVETTRKILLNSELLQVKFITEGFYAVPFSVHGPFPQWSDSVVIRVRSPSDFAQFMQPDKNVMLTFPSDYDALIGEQISGEIRIDFRRKIVSLKASFPKNESHKSKMNGEYAIR